MRAWGTIWRVLVSWLGVATWMLPLAMLVLCGAYLFACLDKLRAPGIPVKFTYEAESGRLVVVQAESYAVDWEHMTVRVYRVRIDDAAGEAMLKADTLRVVYAQPRVDVYVSGVRGRLERLPDGRFSFEDALPKKQEGPAETPFRVFATDVEVTYVDATERPFLARVLSTPALRVEGAGEEVVASSDLRIDDVGLLPLLLTIGSGRVDLAVRFDRAELAPLLPHARRWLDPDLLRDWSPADASSLRVTGPFRLVLAPEQPTLLASNLDIQASGVVLTDVLSGASARLSAQFDAWRARVVGDIVEPGRTARFDGNLAFADEFKVAGNVEASASSEQALWKPLAKLLPRDVRFQSAQWSGPLSWDGKVFVATGKMHSDRLVFQGETLRDTRWALSVDADRLVARAEQAKWNGTTFEGGVQVRFEDGKLEGWAASRRTNLATFVAGFGGRDLAGSVTLQAVLSGTTAKPDVTLAARGQAVYSPKDGEPRYLGIFEGRGRLDGEKLAVSRFSLTSQSGSINAYGSLALDRKTLDARLFGGGIDLREFHPDLGGTGFFDSTVTGTLDAPVVEGKVEAYGLEYDGYEVPIVSASILATRDRLEATDLRASMGAADVDGSVSWHFESGNLDGSMSAKRVSLQDWFGTDVRGLAMVPEAKLSGTVENPILAATVEVAGARAYDVDIERSEVVLRLDKAKAIVERGTVELGQGQSIAFTGDYAFETKQGRADGSFENLRLERVPLESEDIALGGGANGSFSLAIENGKIDTLTGEVSMSEVFVNGVPIGGGSASVQSAGGLWTGTAQIGQLGRYLLVPLSTYDEATSRIDAKLESYNFPLETIIDTLHKPLTGVASDLRVLADEARGQITGTIALSGKASDPDITFDAVSATDLVIANRSAGAVELKASRTGRHWDLDSLTWLEGQPGVPKARLVAGGTLDEDGDIDIRGDLQNFDLDWLHSLAPSIPKLAGKAGFAFVLGGPTRSPNLIESSFTTSGLGYVDASGKEELLPIHLLVSDLTILDGVLVANGMVSYQDFSGKLEARVPLGALNGDPAVRERARATLTANPRDASELDEAFTWLDTKRSTGQMGANLTFEGVPGDYRITAGLVTTGRIAAKGFDTMIDGLQVSGDFRNGKLKIGAEAESSFGGGILVEAEAVMAEPQPRRFDLQDWLSQCLITGTIAINDLVAAQSPGTRNQIAATANGTIEIAGNLFSPVLRGKNGEPVLLRNVDVTMPSEFGGQAAAPEYFVNPRFDRVAVALGEGARIRTGTANLLLDGSGILAGSLQYPDLTAELVIEKGTFRLPNNRVELEPGGQLDFAYRTGPYIEPRAVLDVNLEGRTNISARRYGDTIERYEITVAMRGDILQDGGVNITASSDPPDLSQEQILSVLGQRDLIEAFAQATLRPGNQATRELVLGYFLPSLVTPLTDSLASGLNLDYVNIEYNPFDQTVITAAKSFSRGLTLIVRRQLNTLPGQRPRYEVKLNYRPPFRNWIIGRSRFGIGFDQDRPWKVTFEYGIRF